MDTSPLLGPSSSDTILAWKGKNPVSCGVFFTHLQQIEHRLPAAPCVINLCKDRYNFWVGFAAALLKKQVTLLPPSRAQGDLQRLVSSYSPTYCLTDSDDNIPGVPAIHIDLNLHVSPRHYQDISIPNDQVAAMAFTSGSTGQPRANMKSWGSLVEIAKKSAKRLGWTPSQPLTFLATVPHQHMYGLEGTIMLPVQHGWAFHSGWPFYPEDIRTMLDQLPTKRVLVSTPVHLRACLMEHTQLPPLVGVLSATSPLTQELACQVEGEFQTSVYEIYGFAEAGTIAMRRTGSEVFWHLLEGLHLIPDTRGYSVQTPYFQDPVPIPDSIQPEGSYQFFLEGRPTNMVNIGGHRTSLEELSEKLNSVEGIEDGVFCMPEERDGRVTRLIAFVVAPGLKTEDILSALRPKMNPVFLPRPLVFVDRLPRNPTGKLPRENLQELMEQHQL